MAVELSRGYLMIPRDLTEQLFQLPESDFKVFHWLYFRASYRDGAITDRGEIKTSIDKVAEGTGFSFKRARLSLERLEKVQLITRKRADKGQSIRIVDYDKYNDPTSYLAIRTQIKGNERANGGQSEGTQRATLEEVRKKERKKEVVFASLQKKDGETTTTTSTPAIGTTNDNSNIPDGDLDVDDPFTDFLKKHPKGGSNGS